MENIQSSIERLKLKLEPFDYTSDFYNPETIEYNKNCRKLVYLLRRVCLNVDFELDYSYVFGRCQVLTINDKFKVELRKDYTFNELLFIIDYYINYNELSDMSD